MLMLDALHDANLATNRFAALHIQRLVLIIDLDGHLAHGGLVLRHSNHRIRALSNLLSKNVVADVGFGVDLEIVVIDTVLMIFGAIFDYFNVKL